MFKAVKKRKGSGYVDCQQFVSIDRNLVFFKLKLLILRQWWQLWMKSTAIKQRYQRNSLKQIFVVFCLIVLLPNLMSKLFHNQCKLICKLLINPIEAYMYANEQLGPCFYALHVVRYSVVQLWNYTKTIIRLRLSEYCWIIVKYQQPFERYSTS